MSISHWEVILTTLSTLQKAVLPHCGALPQSTISVSKHINSWKNSSQHALQQVWKEMGFPDLLENQDFMYLFMYWMLENSLKNHWWSFSKISLFVFGRTFCCANHRARHMKVNMKRKDSRCQKGEVFSQKISRWRNFLRTAATPTKYRHKRDCSLHHRTRILRGVICGSNHVRVMAEFYRSGVWRSLGCSITFFVFGSLPQCIIFGIYLPWSSTSWSLVLPTKFGKF